MMDWKGWGRSRSSSVSRHYLGFCLEGLGKTTKPLRIVPVEVRTGHFVSTSHSDTN
jgi:hypothetical protein